MRRTKYEFVGPHGPLILIAAVPLAILILLKVLEKYTVPTFKDADLNLSEVVASLRTEKLFAWNPFLAIIGWLALQLGLYISLPGEEVLGLPLENGEVLAYPINGFSSLISTTLLIIILLLIKGTNTFIWIAENLKQLCVASIVVCTVLSAALYIYSHRRGANIIKKNDTGFLAYDFWMGRELNPRICGVDIKYFFELRPGLMGWILVSFSLLIKQYMMRGAITAPSLFVFVAQFMYVADSLKHEASILSTSDITKEGFGYMLCLGSMVVEPFLYSIQSNYLLNRNCDISVPGMCALVFMNLIGMYIFRSSNNQKDHFKRCFSAGSKDINPRNYLIAKDGKPLLCAGWWGLARHINYSGDWLISMSWCFATGVSSVVPYIYAIYFTLLLLHRELRDEAYCKVKKGSAWREYCRAVPWRFIPHII